MLPPSLDFRLPCPTPHLLQGLPGIAHQINPWHPTCLTPLRGKAALKALCCLSRAGTAGLSSAQSSRILPGTSSEQPR